MKEYLGNIPASPLFEGIEDNELQSVLRCLSPVIRFFDKGAYILRQGDCTEELGLVLSGAVSVVKEDFWGNQTIMARILPGQLFAETYACSPGTPLSVSAVSEVPCSVLLLNVGRILAVCGEACPFHSRLVRNLLGVLAKKNLLLNEKITHTSQRTTRAKLLSYLSAESQRQGGGSFLCPFNRQQLAAYLSVDRSAMSAELGRMRDEGLIRYDKNRFTLIG